MAKLNSNEKVIIVDKLTKTYVNGKKKTVALDQISFEVTAGTLFGLIGPDGGGKTSLFRILTSLLLPDDGTVFVDSLNVQTEYKTLRQRIGYMPGKFSLYTDLTIQENIEFFASLFGTTFEENYDLIKDLYIQIAPFKDRRAGKLSGGMKQKLALCCALIHRPKILFLDEPTTGVDAVSRKEFWEMLQLLKAEGITIVVSTPYMDEATLCDQVALIQEGKILDINTPQNIIQGFEKAIYAIKSSNMLQLLKQLEQDALVEHVYPFGEFHHIVMKQQNSVVQVPEGAVMQKIIPNIEDVFIDLMRSHA
ncbi:MAG: ABC transporter ATP-binding protein [Crocinitomicaceae bacterium]|nr:ABC transporter ATP-binding protein [Crocinitomicaceae bacterium]